MIKPNDFSKITFFPERDLPKTEISNISSAPSDFQILLQNTKEEDPLDNRQIKEILSKEELKDIDTSKVGKNQELPSENPKNESLHKDNEKDSPEFISNPDKDTKNSGFEIENSGNNSDSTIYPKNRKFSSNEQSNLSNDLPNIEKNVKVLSIASILLPVFQKEGVNELFHEKLKSNEREKSITSKEIFPQKSQKESGDLLKNAFLSTNIEKSKSMEKVENESKKFPTNEKEKLNLKISNIKSSVDELKSLQTSKIDDKSQEMIKNSLPNTNVVQGEFSLFNNKDDKKNKPQSVLKINSESSKKESSSEEVTNKLFLKENTTVQKVSKDDQISITEKLKRLDNISPRKEKDSLSHVDLFKDNFLDKKTEEKSSQPTSNSIEQKSKQLDTKSEVRSSQKPETVSRNFAEIVKAARIQIVENGKNSAEISLQPKELGKITLFVSEENNRLEGKILVENEATKQMILGDLAGLKADLKAGGLDLFEIQVDINYDSPFKFTSSGKDREKNENQSQFSSNTNEIVDESENDNSLIDTNPRILDLKV